MSKMWEVVRGRDAVRHVIPAEDVREHEPLAKCWCAPTEDDGVLVHHATDEGDGLKRGNASNR